MAYLKCHEDNRYTDAPKITRSMQISIEDLNLSHLWIVYPGKEDFKLSSNISASALGNIEPVWKYR